MQRAAPHRTTTKEIYIWKKFGWIWEKKGGGVVWERIRCV